MASVTLTGNLKQLTGGTTDLKIDAGNIRDLLRELGRRYPELAPHLEEGIAVAIDGEIYQDAWFAKIAPDAEVHLLPKIAGG